MKILASRPGKIYSGNTESSEFAIGKPLPGTAGAGWPQVSADLRHPKCKSKGIRTIGYTQSEAWPARNQSRIPLEEGVGA
jgi:hypothetical protein